MTGARILVVDDDPGLVRLLALRLGAVGHTVQTAHDGTTALAMASAACPDLVITDLRMPGLDGLGLFDALRRRFPSLPVIVLTAHGTIPDAVDATRRGLFAFLTKPFDSQELLDAVAKALQLGGVEAGGESWREAIVTRSARMEELLRRARQVADADTSVMLLGPSGSGKELLAQAIRRASRRRDGPFVAVNCAAIPESLLESELFGVARGAYTGAVADRPGLLVAAHGGTLFLDEIGDMPAPFQARLLRALQEREVRAVGATESRPIDVRVISATHRDLDAEIAAGRFRADLRYRLDVVTLQLPGLDERREDIPLLARRFVADLAAQQGRPALTFAADALDLLVHAPWPGHVRQLRNVVEQCVALCAGPLIAADLVADALRERPPALPTLDQARDDAERAYLVQILRLTDGNVSQAARLAGRNRTEFYKLLGRHGLDPGGFRSE